MGGPFRHVRFETLKNLGGRVGAAVVWTAFVSAASWAGAGAGVPGSDPPVEGAPRIRIEQPRLDLGTVVRGRTVSAVFRFENVGDAPLRILEAKPG